MFALNQVNLKGQLTKLLKHHKWGNSPDPSYWEYL